MPAAARLANWPYPRVLAHRADDVPVLLHDATLDRTTGAHGPVDRLSAAELGRLDAGSWFGSAYAHARIPTLEQVLAFCSARGMWLNVEIKPIAGREERTGRIVAQVVARHGTAGAAPLLSSFSAVALAAARAAAPQLARGMLFSAIPADWRRTLEELACASLHCDHRRLTRARARAVKDQGYGLLCYTVNDPDRAAALRAWGVDAICTDRIDLLEPDPPPQTNPPQP